MNNLMNTAGSIDALLRAIEDPSPGWDLDDPAAILAHQLDAPLLQDLVTLDGVDAESVTQLTVSHDALESFGELLSVDDPPRLLLEAAKDYFKPSAAKTGGPVPHQVALVCYYAAIAAAQRAGQPALSRMPQPDLRNAMSWARERTWLTPQLTELFDAVLP